MSGLVIGEKYELSLQVDTSFRQAKEFTAKSPAPIDLGDMRVDTIPYERYVPPTPAEQAARSFVPTPSTSAAQRKDKVLTEARREYTRPLLLFGRPKDPACIELFRLFAEEPEEGDAEKVDGNAKRLGPTPSSLRWEFELASFDTVQSDVRKFAETLGIKIEKDRPPVLAVLHTDGSIAATHALALGPKQKLDGAALTSFLVKHKLPTRNAEQMLADAFKKAKADDKRVFYIASASWCGPCRLLGRFLEPWKSELERHFVFVKLDVSRDEHAEAVTKRFQGDHDGGVPWYAILESDGKVLITSNAPDMKRQDKAANIGFPTEPAEIEHFMKMLSQNAPRLGERQVNELRQALGK